MNGDTARNLFPEWHSIKRGSCNSFVEEGVTETYMRNADESSIPLHDETLIEEDSSNSIKGDPIKGNNNHKVLNTEPNKRKELQNRLRRVQVIFFIVYSQLQGFRRHIQTTNF
jgi:hypothetical protein